MESVNILFVSFTSGWHEDVWNVLAIESLVGDLEGFYGSNVSIKTVRIRDLAELSDTVHKMKGQNYDFVGLSLDIGSQKFLTQFLEKVNETEIKSVFIMGGTLVTYAMDYLLELQEVQALTPIFIIGEGELAWREIIKRFFEAADYYGIDNTWVYDKRVKKYLKGESSRVDLEKLIYPPAHIQYFGEKHPVHILQTSRNCIGHCSYCSQGPNKRWRSFSYDRIEQNLRDLIELGIYEFEFVDDEFFGGFTSFYIDRGWKIADIFHRLEQEYNNSFRFRLFTNPFIICSEHKGSNGKGIIELLKALKEVGLSRVYLGIESGSEGQRKRYARLESLEQCENAIKILDEIGIVVDAGFIMFDPEVTMDEILENIQFIRKNNFVKYNTWPLRPLTLTNNTPVFYKTKELGLIKERDIENPASYLYDFINPEVKMFYEAVSKVANESSKVFYILKYFYKSYCYNIENSKLVSKAYDLLMENASINLDYLDNMIVEFRESNQIEKSSKLVREELLDLMDRVEKLCCEMEKINYATEYLVESIKDAKKILLYNVSDL